MNPATNKQLQFAELLQQHQAIVFKVAHTYCWHQDDRDELTQEIATQLWRAFPGYDDTRRFSTWMYRIGLNVAISYVRKHHLRQQHLVAFDERVHDTAVDTGQNDDGIEFLNGFINQLDSLNRALLLLYLEDRNQREIAEILGISESNVATKISRLKQRLRRASETSTDNNRSESNDRSSHHGTR